MWIVWLFYLCFFADPASAEFGLDEKCERDYNILPPSTN